MLFAAHALEAEAHPGFNGAMGNTGPNLNHLSPAQAAVLLDMHAAGITAEVGEAPYPWFASAPPILATANPISQTPAIPMARPASLGTVTETPNPKPETRAPAPKPRVPLLAQTAAAARAAARPEIWTLGQGNGLTIITRTPMGRVGQCPVDDADMALLANMLKAVGLPSDELNWVGLAQPDETVRPEQQTPLQAALSKLNPSKTLVLGQVALGTLLGRTQGVDGWHANPSAWQGATLATTGATYTLALLREQPTFKARAWQHLLAWKHRWENAA